MRVHMECEGLCTVFHFTLLCRMLAFNRFTAQALARPPQSRPNTPEPATSSSSSGGVQRCSFTTSSGFKCPNYSRHTYDGQELCNVHLGYVKAREPCSICLEPMGERASRCKLGCGHYFHCDCIKQCVAPECPQCRQQIAAVQASKLFYSSKIEPLSQRLFSLPSKRISAVLSSLDKVIAAAERSGVEEWEIEYLGGMIDSFTYGLGVCDHVCEVVDALPEEIMSEAGRIYVSSLMHLNQHMSFTGFQVEGCYDVMETSSMSPTSFQQLYTEPAYVPTSPTYVPYENVPLIRSEASDDVLVFGGGDQSQAGGHGGHLV